MTPKEKAKELHKRFMTFDSYKQIFNRYCFYDSKRWNMDSIGCALICVDEILKICTQSKFIDYWQEVKQELEKL